MALTDRSLIPLKPSDFKRIQGERRLSDIRLAERLGFERIGNIRTLIERWQSFLEQQSGKVLHRAALSQARGFAAEAYFLTIPEVIFVAGKSEAKNADVVQYEAAVIAAHWIEGTEVPEDAAPTLRALAAPDRPQLVTSPEWQQPTLFEPAATREDLLEYCFQPGEPEASNAFHHDVWLESEDGRSFIVCRERDKNGATVLFEYLCRTAGGRASTDGYQAHMPWVNGSTVLLRLNHLVPFALVERTYLNQLPEGKSKDCARISLQCYLAL